jgi:hypothetical protein
LIRPFSKPLVELRHGADIRMELLIGLLKYEVYSMHHEHLLHLYDAPGKVIHDLHYYPKQAMDVLRIVMRLHLLQRQFADHKIDVHFIEDDNNI